jgi:molybdopterin-containing oxidoreductase family iron-sulfur binding subunit
MMQNTNKKTQKMPDLKRRNILKKIGLAGAVVGTSTVSAYAVKEGAGEAFNDSFQELFQKHYRKMSKEEITEAIARLERRAKKNYAVEMKIGTAPPLDNVIFGYALNISKCKGYRKCVTACAQENNTSRDPQIQYIRVLEMDKGDWNLEHAEGFYKADEEVPRPGKMYLPIQCHHCENAPCVKACPTQATWQERDGIVVVDYNWCIGCHYCVVACPYWARRFNWEKPTVPKEEINRDTHYLGNRMREAGVMEKCTFCINRTRKGQQPACQEACPTGARVFGNILDPKSEIRYILENKHVFRLKEELNTEPKFWYYQD